MDIDACPFKHSHDDAFDHIGGLAVKEIEEALSKSRQQAEAKEKP